MKLPRFNLRTLFAVMALISVPIGGWVAYQFAWIHQRHAFIGASDVFSDDSPGISSSAPWQIAIFGENSPINLRVPAAKLDRAKELFPELQIRVR
jgi:hypothetical protein